MNSATEFFADVAGLVACAFVLWVLLHEGK